MINQDLAQIFDETADLLALLGENAFRINAYRKISRILDDLPQTVDVLLGSGQLAETPGIGANSVDKISEYLRTGQIAEFIEIRNQVPAGVKEMLQVPGLGPKTAALLWHEQDITSLEQLGKALDQPNYGRLSEIAGLGNKKLEKIKQSLAFLNKSSGLIPLGRALPIAEELVALIRSITGVRVVEYVGALRRGMETVPGITLAVGIDTLEAQIIAAVFDILTTYPLTDRVLVLEKELIRVQTSGGGGMGGGFKIEIQIVLNDQWGSRLLYLTGAEAHWAALEQVAEKQGKKLTPEGLFQGDKLLESKGEREIYGALGLAYIPSEIREDQGELNAGESTEWEILETAHIHGDLHMHTSASDGRNTLEEMVAEAKRRGFSYIAITDHSKSSFQANGLTVERLLEHCAKVRAIARDAAASGMLILAGSEVDILADGSLDYEDDVLAELDWVVASPHAALTQESQLATARLIRVVANPYVHVVGHPTGRLVPNRKGLEPDMEKVIFAAARNGVAMELNANHHRLDLRPEHLKLAKEAHVPVCINTDAHDLADFNELRYGILTARRGFLKPADVLNTKSLVEFRFWLENRRQQAQW